MTMQAMVFKKPHTPLVLQEIQIPKITADEILIQIKTCGICRTDLHIFDGELPNPNLPLIMGHQIVGVVTSVGDHVRSFIPGDRVGIPWLASSCGQCEYCRKDQENLCESAKYTGYDCQGGFAQYTKAKADFALKLPEKFSDEQIAPLLCAGLIGYRSYRKAKPLNSLGLYGFGSAAHIITQIAIFEEKSVYAFTRAGDRKTQEFARRLGAIWAGGSNELPPVLLDSAIIFAPVGQLIPQALKSLKKSGQCICGGIHMSDIPSFPYSDLWGEKKIESVANLTRKDGEQFFALSAKVPLSTNVTVYPLEQVNEALEDLRHGRFQGSGVIKI